MENKKKCEFDGYVASYDDELEKGISLTGEDKIYFIKGRAEWLSRQLNKFCLKPSVVLDFGCGIGASSEVLLDKLKLDKVIGVDVSEKCLAEAHKNHASEAVDFVRLDLFFPQEQIDLVYCNGVFHHIPPEGRVWTLDFIYRSLRPGGVFALWENNPWNLGTRLIMKRVVFDQEAVMVWPSQAKKMLMKAGFDILTISYLFVFPRAMRMFRGLEPALSSIPAGGQYLVLGRKSS